MSECCLNYIPDGFRDAPREWEAFKEQAARKGMQIHNPWCHGPHGGQGVPTTPLNSPEISTDTEAQIPVPSRGGRGTAKRGDLGVWHGDKTKGGRPGPERTESEQRAYERDRKRERRKRARG